MRYCDLHTHSTASDGTTPPAELPALARRAGLSAVALTDHDTTAGLVQCAHACEEQGVQFVPGIEVSADPGPAPPPPETAEDDVAHDAEQRRGTLHILGLFIRHDDSQIAQVEHRMRDARDSRNPAIVDKLNELGVDISYDDVLDLARRQGSAIVGRPHIAQVMLDRGHVATLREAFERYIGQNGIAYVRRDRLPARDAISAIHHAGGLAIMAHPIQTGLSDPGQLEQLVVQLKNLGLNGIETRHSDHSPHLAEQYELIASQLNMLTSGGSDFHGDRKDVVLGGQRVPLEVYERLHNAWQKRDT